VKESNAEQERKLEMTRKPGGGDSGSGDSQDKLKQIRQAFTDEKKPPEKMIRAFNSLMKKDAERTPAAGSARGRNLKKDGKK
jgi:hypothetical protein